MWCHLLIQSWITKPLTISCKNQSDITRVNEVYISMMSCFMAWKSSNLLTPQTPLGAGPLPEDPRRGSSWIASRKGQTWFCSPLWNTRSRRQTACPRGCSRRCSCGTCLKIVWHLVMGAGACTSGCHPNSGCAGPCSSGFWAIWPASSARHTQIKISSDTALWCCLCMLSFSKLFFHSFKRALPAFWRMLA